MKWFYNLKRVVRVIIAVISWLPLFIFAGVIGGSVGENGENMQTWQALIICALLAVGVVFTVFAIKARAKETKADRDAKRAERAENASRKKITATQSRQIKISDEAIKSKPVTTSDTESLFSGTPSHVVKLIRNGNEEMQDNIATCNIGDDIYVDFDFDKGLYLCSTCIGDIGYLPEKIGDTLTGKFCVKVTDVKQKDDGKYCVEVSIYPPLESNGFSARIVSGVDFPIFTKAVGVTFGNCQTSIRESKIGDALIIKHAPTTEYPDSTDIINARTGERVGRIKADLAQEFLTAFDRGFVLDGEIADITGGSDGQNYGCNVKIVGEHIDK